jgi:hypothetical protein
MQRAEIEGVVAAVSVPAAVTVSRDSSKRAKLRGVLVELVTAERKAVHLLLASSADSIQLLPGQKAVFVVEEAVQCHGRTLLCAAVRERASCGSDGGVLLPSLPTVEEFQGNDDKRDATLTEILTLPPSMVRVALVLRVLHGGKTDMWARWSEAERLVWMDRAVSLTATVECVRPWAVAQLAGGLCLFKPPS